MYWEELDAIPAKNSQHGVLRGDDWHAPSRLRGQTYPSMLHMFYNSDMQHARCIFDHDQYDARMILSGFNSSIRQGKWHGVRMVTRGDAVYITRDPAPERLRSAALDRLLHAFDDAGTHDATVDTAGLDETETQRLYMALQKQRTRGGLGNIKISRRDGGITLLNIVIDA